MKESRYLLSKTRYLRGVQCPKALYFDLFNQSSSGASAFDLDKQALFKQGHRVESFARKLYEDGKSLKMYSGFDMTRSITDTLKAVRSNGDVFYNGSFTSNHGLFKLYAETDILIRQNNDWELNEVKSKTKSTAFHIYDLAFQYRILKENFPSSKIKANLLFLNKQYVRRGKIDLEGLFVLKDVTRAAIDNQVLFKRNMIQFNKIALSESMPTIETGSHCFHPYPCKHMDKCWKDISTESAVFFAVQKSNAKKAFDSNIEKDVIIKPKYKITKSEKKSLSIASFKKREINYKLLTKYIADIKNKQVSFLDVNSVAPAIPIYQNKRPYQHTCYQFSMLNNSDEVKSFYASPNHEVEKSFVNEFVKSTAQYERFIGYDSLSMKRRIKELATLFPEFQAELNLVHNRIDDLMQVFLTKVVFEPALRNNFTLRNVSEILLSNNEFVNLNVNQSLNAGLIYSELHESEIEFQRLQKNEILKYSNWKIRMTNQLFHYFNEIIEKH